MKFEVAPLSGSFLLVSIFGFLFSVFFIANLPGGLPWAWAIGLICFIMFVASMISVTRAPVEEELALDEHYTDRRKRVRYLSYKEMKALDAKRAEEKRKAQQKEQKKRVAAHQTPKKKVTKKAPAKKKIVKKKSPVKSTKKKTVKKKSSTTKTRKTTRKKK